MRKFTFLFALFLMMVGTAMAQTYITPGTEKVLTSENLRALTTETPIILCPVQNTVYGQWYDGSSSTSNGTSGTTVTESNIFVWVPILNDGSATGTGYLKKRTAENEDVAYLQTTNTTTFGAQSSAQVFYPVTPVVGGTGNTAFGHDNIVSGYNEANLVRLVCGSSEGATWFNFNGKQYNAGTGIWTAMEVRNATDIQTPAAHTVGEPILNAADLRAGYKYLIRNISASRSGYVYVDADATSENLKTGAISDNTFADKYIFTAEAAEGGVYLKASNGEYIPSATDGNLNTSATPAVVTIAQKGGSYPKTTLNLMVNGNYCNVNPGKMCIWNDVNDANGVWQIIPVDADDFLAVTIHNQLHANNSQTVDMGSYTVSLLPNQWVVGRVTLEYITEGDAVQIGDATTEVTCTSVEALPFEASASFSDAKWYLVDMHSNDNGAGDILSGAKNYIWTATTDASAYTTAEVTLPKYDTKQSATFGDNMLWCFVGNAFDGFVIYNKAAGSEYALAKPETGNTATKLAAVGDATPFRIYKSTQITGAACFKKQGDDNYVNTQSNASTGNVKVLRGWNDTDGGSSCRFFAPDHYLLNYAADITAGPANSLGTAQYFNAEGKFESFNSAIDAANANHFSATATANLATILTEYASDEANATTNATTITDGGYYRLMNFKYKTYMTNGTDGSYNDLKGGVSASDAAKTVGTVVKFVADESNYKLYVQDLAVGKTAISTQVNLTEEGIFTITSTNNKYGFKDVSTAVSGWENYRYLHCDGSNKIVGWEIGAEASKWYVVPAESIDVALTNVGTSNYATAYLPFAVQGSGLYTGGISADKTALTMTAQENAVPAKTGLVIKSDNPTVTLTICDSADPVSANSLIGSLTPVTENLSNYLVLGKGNTSNSIGFFAPSASLTSIAANKAYLNASDVASGEGSAIALNFGGTSTAILDVVNGTLESNAPVFDLSGRRVMKTVKGSLYIQNGKKFIAR